MMEPHNTGWSGFGVVTSTRQIERVSHKSRVRVSVRLFREYMLLMEKGCYSAYRMFNDTVTRTLYCNVLPKRLTCDAVCTLSKKLV